MTNVAVAIASLREILADTEPMNPATRASIERALSELEIFDPEALAQGLDRVRATASLQAALAAIEEALSTATAVPTLIALGLAGRKLNHELHQVREIE